MGPAGKTAPGAERPFAVARLAVDHDQRQGLSKARVLVAVVEDQRPGPGGHGCVRPGGPVARDPERAVARQHQRFVAHLAAACEAGSTRIGPGSEPP
jgi:hypothetical protein